MSITYIFACIDKVAFSEASIFGIKKDDVSPVRLAIIFCFQADIPVSILLASNTAGLTPFSTSDISSHSTQALY
jgi:hypothetical protein